MVLSASNATDERFTDTTWSIVIAAGATTPARAHEGMAKLCRIYWRPIYAYLRRSGYGKHDAEDLTQGFLHHLLENDTLRRASQQRGRFPCFLVGVLKTHIHRLRRQFASAVRREVMETVGAPHEVDDELRQLRGVFARIGQGQAA